ncbi:MAG: hypothetical protein RBT61_00970 [Candidatus Kapabacteria bacterium]|jgi:hypothetical protein|nr:hypothetical protein [Candidatus Kapabacteria bacterium]
MKQFPGYIGILLLVVSCRYFTQEIEPEAIARVNDFYLYKEEVSSLVPEGTEPQDSITIVRNYIDRWATQKLLINAALVNLSPEKQKEYDKLVEQYKIDLYTKGYLEDIVKRSIDTVVTNNEIADFYRTNKENFKTNNTLVRLRYIQLPIDHPNFDLIRSKFFDTKPVDKDFWSTYQLQFKNSALNDSVWVEMNQVYRRLPFITPENKTEYLVSGKSAQVQDSLDIYLLKISGVIDNNQTAPFEYVKSTIKEVIVNRRKLEVIKKFEKEITEDAFKNKKYEILQ